MEGVELKDGAVRLTTGYKFVNKPEGKIAVERMAGGPAPQVSGSWTCDCSEGSGGCATLTTGKTLSCLAKKPGCTGSCTLVVITDGVKRGVIMY